MSRCSAAILREASTRSRTWLALWSRRRSIPYLCGRENLRLLGALDGGTERRRIDDVLEQVALPTRARDRVGTYSLGMRQRLGIASALIAVPKLLVLDEPANGLDPAGIRDMRTLIGSLPEHGVTVLYSSHLLAEVEEVCNRVAIINDGTIAFRGAARRVARLLRVQVSARDRR